MYPQNDTLTSIQNSTINITQLMTTTTTSNRRSRFYNPGHANPAQEDEDIYMSLQVLQAQLNTRSAPPGSQELLERVLSKVEKLQTTVNAFSENYDFVRRGGNGNVFEQAQRNHVTLPHGTLKQNQQKSQQSQHDTQELAFRNTIAEKDAQLDRVQSKHKAAQNEIIELQNELQATKTRSNELHENAIMELRQQVERLEFRLSQQDSLQRQIEILSIKVNEHEQYKEQIFELQQKVGQFESIQQEKIDLEDKYRSEQEQNNHFLQKHWMLEAENNKLKKAVVNLMQGKQEIQEPDADTVIYPPDTDTESFIRTMLEEELRTKTGFATKK